MKTFFLNFLLSVIVGCLSQEPKDAADVKCSYNGQFIPDPYDCSIYYICNGLSPETVRCPTGEYFNPLTSVCEPASQVPCGVIKCDTPGQLIPDPVDCAVFYVCDVNLNSFQEQCPTGQVFDPADDQCDLPSNVAGHCGNTATTTSVPTAPPGVVCATPGQMIPDPYDCQVFYICNGNLYPMYNHCGGNLEFNPAIENCDLPENVVCPGETTSTTAPTAPPGVVCTTPGQMIPDPYNCQVFYICNGQLYPMYNHCGGNLEFNPAIENCDLPENVVCPGETTSTAVPTAPPSVVCTTPGQMIPDPYDCQVFYICNEQLYPMYRHCSGGLEFNPVVGNCDLPENVNCPVGSSTIAGQVYFNALK